MKGSISSLFCDKLFSQYYFAKKHFNYSRNCLQQGSQTGISRAACGPSTCSVRPATKIKIRKCPKMTRFLYYFRKMRPLNTFLGLYAARETIFNQNVSLEDIWVWDPWFTTTTLATKKTMDIVYRRSLIRGTFLLLKKNGNTKWWPLYAGGCSGLTV